MSFILHRTEKNKAANSKSSDAAKTHIQNSLVNNGPQESVVNLQRFNRSQESLITRLRSNESLFDFSTIRIQPKLKVSQPGDAYEQEADRIADAVIATPVTNPAPVTVTHTQPKLHARRSCSTCKGARKDKDEKFQTSNLEIGRKATNNNSSSLKTSDQITNEINTAIKSDSGKALDPSTRHFMETQFGHDFSTVRIHTDQKAVQSAQLLNAHAYTVGTDIVFDDAQYQPDTTEGKRLLAHELTHVVQQSSAPLQESQPGASYGSAAAASLYVQRDLARPPTGAPDALVELTPEQIEEAIAFNESQFTDPYSILRIRDVLGIEPIGIVDEALIRAVVQWQSEFHLQQDGKIGLATFRSIIRELQAEGQRDDVIVLIIDFFHMPTRGLVSIRFDSTVAANASTSGPIPGNSTVRVGSAAFAQGFAGLVHTIRHELEHVQQRRAGMLNQNLREFLAESVEILSVGMPRENVAGFMDDAGRALHFWNLLSVAEQRANWAQFERVRDEVRRRFNGAPAAEQATHQALMDSYNAVVQP